MAESDVRHESIASTCIGELEHHIHKVFASVRVPGEDFVFYASNELLNVIETYCHDHADGPKPPLLVLGESGTGKSALLSNWLLRKHRNNLKSRSSTEEFIFWHAVGCSRQSTNVNNLIRRLLTDLKTRLELDRDVPVHQDRLSWELPRFLESASTKRGKIIIVIDGVNRLMSDDDNEASLAWLPLELPPNVRFVLSATLPAGGGTLFTSHVPSSVPSSVESQPGFTFITDNRHQQQQQQQVEVDENAAHASETPNNENKKKSRSRILAELERRQWQKLMLKPLDRMQCRNLMNMFVQKTVQSEISAQATGPFLTALSRVTDNMPEVIPGFLLFECHLSGLMSHPQGGIPLFVRIFLRCAHLLCMRGFSLWHIWDEWLKADSVQSLLQAVMKSFEQGFTKTAEGTKYSFDRTCQEGGLAALQKLYSWHPAFQPKNEDETAETIAAIDFAQVAGDRSGRASANLLTASRAKGKAGQASNNTGLLQSLGDQQWLNAADQAEAKFEEARKRAERSVTETVQRAIRDDKGGLMDSMVYQLPALAPNSQPEMLSNKSQSINSLGSSDYDEEEDDDDYDDDDDSAGESSIGDDDASLASCESDQRESSKSLASPKTAPLPVLSHEKKAMQEVVGAFLTTVKEENTSDFNSRTNSGEAAAAIEHSASTTRASASPLPSILQSSKSYAKSKKGSTRGSLSSIIRANSTKSLGLASSKRSSRHHDGNSSTRSITDGSEGIETLPLYLRGGMNVPGLGPLLGNALAFLYVARHGLKEHEIWAMLATLNSEQEARQFQNEQNMKQSEISIPMIRSVASSTGPVPHTAHASVHKKAAPAKPTNTVAECQRRLLQWCYHERGSLEDIWRTEDLNQTNMITVGQMVSGWNKIVPTQDSATNRAELMALLDIVDLYKAPPASFGDGGMSNHGSVVCENSDYISNTLGGTDAMRVNYIELVKRISKYEQTARRQEMRSKLVSKTSNSSTGTEKLDSFLLPPGGSTEMEGKSKIGNSIFEDNSLGESGSAKKDNKSLGPIVEESLLIVLCALGVLHSPENQVLILPLDSGLFRDVVRQDYVKHRGGETTWHGHLIRHFQCEINCMRRCEELPWHLQLCRKWYALKDTLTDLKTFQLMYGSDLKDELMSYWLTLTEGPLFVSDDAQKLASQGPLPKPPGGRKTHTLLKVDYVENSRMLSELDSAAALGLSEKEARKQLLKDQIAPFDIVEEFNRSVEYWVTTGHPSAAQLGQIVSQIARFLADFSRLTKPSPNFLRLGVDMAPLLSFGIKFDDIKSIVDSMTNHQAKEGKQDQAKDEEFGKNSAELEPSFPTPQQVASNLYPYLRWIWIQFPWFALENAGEFGKAKLANQKGAFLSCQSADKSKDATVFKDEFDIPTKIETPNNTKKERYWKVLKRDPFLPVVSITESKKASTMISSIKQSTNTLRVLENSALNLHYEDCRLFGGQKGRPDHLRQSTAKFRRCWEDELEGLSGIPFSEHSSKSIGKSTLFPSVKKFSEDKNKMMEQEDGQLYTHAAAVVRRGGQCPNFEPDLEDELQRLLEAEQLARYNDSHSGPIPLSESQAELERESNRMAKLRSLADKALLIRKEREKLCKELKLQIQTREQEDTNAQAGVVSGEMAVDAIENRLETLNNALAASTDVSMGYKQILNLVGKCPPFSDSHLMEVEQNLTLARQQLADLIQYRKNMYINAEKLEIVKSRQLMAKKSYYAEARAQLAKKRNAYMMQHGLFNADDKRMRSDSHSQYSEDNYTGSLLNKLTPNKPRKLRQMMNDGRSMDLTEEESDSQIPNSILQTDNVSKVMATFVGAFQRVSKFQSLLKSKNPSVKGKSDEDSDSDDNLNSANRSMTSRNPSLQQSSNSVPGSRNPTRANTRDKESRRANRKKTHISRSNTSQGKYYYDSDSSTHKMHDPKGKHHGHSQFRNDQSAENNAHSQVQYILEQTNCANENEFIERFANAQNVNTTLTAYSSLQDSQKAQLEKKEQSSSLGEDIFESEDASSYVDADVAISSKHLNNLGGGGSIADEVSAIASITSGTFPLKDGGKIDQPIGELDSRNLDKTLIQAEMKLSQLQKQMHNALLVINEMRTGVGHLVAILVANAKLVGAAVAKSNPPPLQADEDIEKCLQWCEERVQGITEAMMIDSSKPAGGITDDSKSLMDRQTQLAALVHGMLKDSQLTDKSVMKRKKLFKKAGDMSRAIIAVTDMTISPMKGIVVHADGEVDKTFEKEMKDLENKRERHADKLEKLAEKADVVDAVEGVQKFLVSALGTHDSKEMLRKANVLTKSKQGKNAGYGFALESLMESEGLSDVLKSKQSSSSGSVGVAGRKKSSTGRKKSSTLNNSSSPSKDEIAADKADIDEPREM